MVRTIIFDFGGVVIDIDYVRTIKKFKKYGIEDFENRFSKAVQDDFFQKFERGEVSKREFLTKMRLISGGNLNDGQIISAWNALIVGYSHDRIELLRKIKPFYRLILLSNTNEIHIEEALRLFSGSYDFDFYSLFHHVYWSYKTGMRKPEPRIFHRVLDKHHLLPEETLFIDDSIQHIEAAKSLGIQTYHLNDGEDITQLFDANKLSLILPSREDAI